MTLVLAALVVLAITTIVVMTLGLRCSSNLAQATSGGEALGRRVGELEAKVVELEAERDALGERCRFALEASDRLERARRAAQDSAHAAISRSAELEASLAMALADPGPGSGGDEATLELLLTRVERQWAEALGVGPDERGVRDGAPSDQVAEALGRELERIKEEVGVETRYLVFDPVPLADPTAFLLAAGEVIAVLASGCEQVHAELDSGLVLLGKGWAGSVADLNAAVDRAVSAGLQLEPLDLTDGDVRLGLRSGE